MTVRIRAAAALQIDAIYRYTRDRWRDAQPDRCITGLFDSFDGIIPRTVTSRPVPAAFGVAGFFYHYQRHYV